MCTQAKGEGEDGDTVVIMQKEQFMDDFFLQVRHFTFLNTGPLHNVIAFVFVN